MASVTGYSKAKDDTRHLGVFYVEDYGAVGDGKLITDAAITTATATLTSATANFTAADVGKAIIVNGAGVVSSVSGALITTISSFTNSTTVVLATSASRTVTAQNAVYGTDDTAAIQAAMSALSDYVDGQPFYGELVFQPKIYCLATAPTPGGDPAKLTYGNAQIPIPVLDTVGNETKRVIVIRGTFDGSVLNFWKQKVPQLSGTVLLSMLEVTSYDGTYGPPSIIGGPTTHDPFTNSYNNVMVSVTGLTLLSPYNPGQIGLDFWGLCQYGVGTVYIGTMGTPNGDPSLRTLPTNNKGQGLRQPDAGTNDRCDIYSLSIEGYYYGMNVDEHVAAHRLAFIYTNTALLVNPGTASPGRLTHAAWIGYASMEVCNYCLFASNSLSDGDQFGIVIDVLDNEAAVTEHIHDTHSVMYGHVNLLPTGGASATGIVPIVNGAKNLEINSLIQTRGAVTAPTVPATTVALVNPFWKHAAVYVNGGTVTAINVDGVATGVTSGMVTVPSGKSIELDYSSAPTWVWTLL